MFGERAGRWAPCLVSHDGLTIEGEDDRVNGFSRTKISLGQFLITPWLDEDFFVPAFLADSSFQKGNCVSVAET